MDERERHEAGMQVRRAVLGDTHVDRTQANLTPLNEEFQDLITRYAWGEIWTRPGLPRHTRSLMTLVMMVALNRNDELKLHLRFARNHGWSEDELAEAILHLTGYVGAPLVREALLTAKEVFAEMRAEAKGAKG